MNHMSAAGKPQRRSKRERHFINRPPNISLAFRLSTIPVHNPVHNRFLVTET